MDDIDILQAEVMRTLAHPRRLQVIHRLSDGPVEVGRIAADLGMSQPNVSQHLAVMRAAGIVEAVRTGREVRYRLSDPEVVAACALLRGVLARRLDRLAVLSDIARAQSSNRQSDAVAPSDPDRRHEPVQPVAVAPAPTR